VFKSLQQSEFFRFSTKRLGNLHKVSSMIRAGDTSPIVAPLAHILFEIQQDVLLKALDSRLFALLPQVACARLRASETRARGCDRAHH
jgi:hypothetical protein